MSKKCRYVEKITKADITPIQKGFMLEESKKSTYGYCMRLIEELKKDKDMDLETSKSILKKKKEEIIKSKKH
tara:strand:- start:1201 stop:1416 length:216 start_codon:yes stop_codon:yes gene_type:complete